MSDRPAFQSRSRSRGLWVVLGIVLIVAGVAAFAWYVFRSTDTQSQVFGGPVDQVRVEVNGTVTIAAGDATEVTVRREWFLWDAPVVDMSLEGGVLRVTADCGMLGFGCRSEVTATVPADAEVVVDTAAGNVDVAGTTGGVDLTTSAGNVDVDDVTGPARLRSSAGNIGGTVTDSDVDAVTSAGGIDLTVLGDFTSISAVTSAGAVDLTVPDEVYSVEADTSAGNITTDVRTDPDAEREIVARSNAGSVTIDRIDG